MDGHEEDEPECQVRGARTRREARGKHVAPNTDEDKGWAGASEEEEEGDVGVNTGKEDKVGDTDTNKEGREVRAAGESLGIFSNIGSLSISHVNTVGGRKEAESGTENILFRVVNFLWASYTAAAAAGCG